MDFETAFETLTSNPPFKWQARLFSNYFSKGELPPALDLPTGLGKTSVMAVWLIARAAGARLPRRLVYVVDRRAVVDQATAEAEKLRSALDGEAAGLKPRLGLEDRPLPISTLRGQFVDNREWLVDPTAPSIIIGTVDMIGSRLLFEGYGVSRKMRPYHAGLLGADTLVVLDEAHLVPPFEKLLEAIEKGAVADYDSDRQGALGPRDAAHRKIIPPFRLMSLSATGREREGIPFQLTVEDREDKVIKQRLEAKRAVTIWRIGERVKIEGALAGAAMKLTENGASSLRCLIYCDKRETAQKVFDDLASKAKPQKKDQNKKAEVELFTGARRFFEREETIRRLAPLGFIAGTKNATGKPAFLVATSAAEVGVDLDADHMVCDFVAWERMVQRFGRVNRRGEGDAKIIVVDAGAPKPKKADEQTESEKRALLNYRSHEVIRRLRAVGESGDHDASPAALLDLKRRAAADDALRETIEAATTPAPLRPALNRALVDAWSMTSLETHAVRPEIARWLRGWVDEDGPQTAVVWRTHLPVRTKGGEATDKEIEEFFEAAPPHVSEKLELEPWAVVEWLIERAAKTTTKTEAVPKAADAADETDAIENEGAEANKETTEPMARPLRPGDIIAFALTPARELKRSFQLKEFYGDKKAREALERILAGATLIIDARFGGLSGGLLKPDEASPPRTADDGCDWLWESRPEAGKSGVPLVKFRVRAMENQGDGVAEAQPSPFDWHKPFKFMVRADGEGNAVRSLIVEKWRGASTKEEERSVSRPQSLAEHQSWAEAKAQAIAAGVGLSGDHAKALEIAARLHDEGKKSKRWQRAFNANKADKALDRPLAKTRGPIDFKLLDGYRHEFGSLPHAQEDEKFKKLPADLQDLVLHLIAAHHGKARPVIETRSCDDAPPSALQQRAYDVALRFARLHKQWGPWGLAWWEALLRAADQQASRENDEAGRAKAGSR